MLKISAHDRKFIQATYTSFPASYDSDGQLSWRVVGEPLDPQAQYVCVIGAFDGFHKGHQKLVDQARQLAQKDGSKLVICMFDPDPAVFFNPLAVNEELLCADERISLLMEAGAHSVLCFNFNEHLASLGYREFLLKLTSMFDLKRLCVGVDFKLGKQGEGRFERILAFGKEQGFEVTGVQLLMQDLEHGIKISSTTIRQCLIDGEIQKAIDLADHLTVIDGVVEHGRGEGTSFGFPTANIMCAHRRVAPSKGVYAAWVSNGQKVWPSALNVGLPPTFNDETEQMDAWLLEAFLLDCNENLYGQNLRVFLTTKIGDTQKFDSKVALETTLRGYIQATEDLLGDSSFSL